MLAFVHQSFVFTFGPVCAILYPLSNPDFLFTSLIKEKGFIVGYNHRLGIGKALMAGYRGLSLDVCDCNGVVQFCHNVCGELWSLVQMILSSRNRHFYNNQILPAPACEQ
jgi:hypothetical protein